MPRILSVRTQSPRRDDKICFSKDGALFDLRAITVLQSSRWSADGAVCVFQLKGHITPVRTLAFSPDGLALASGGVGGLMNIWSLRVRHTHTHSHTHTDGGENTHTGYIEVQQVQHR